MDRPEKEMRKREEVRQITPQLALREAMLMLGAATAFMVDMRMDGEANNLETVISLFLIWSFFNFSYAYGQARALNNSDKR